jgi:hypothetical protein
VGRIVRQSWLPKFPALGLSSDEDLTFENMPFGVGIFPA